MGEFVSSFAEIMKGVLQGSVLGPVLFNIFINDLTYIFKHADITNYADDNTLSAVAKILLDCLEILTEESKRAINWFDENQMQADATKFHLIIPGNKENTTPHITFGDVRLGAEKEVDLLGVTIDEKLSFKTHVSLVCRRAE